MKDNKLIKFLIPLIAAVVVFESIVLVNSLENSVDIDQNSVAENQVGEEVIEDPVIDFSFDSTDSAEMKVGSTYKVNLVLLPSEDKIIDGVETYIKYDPEFLKVTKISTTDDLADPEISEIDDDLGLISNVFLIEDDPGWSLISGEEVELLGFSVTPLKEGETALILGTGDEGEKNVTLVVETNTAKSLGWTGGRLDINVIK